MSRMKEISFSLFFWLIFNFRKSEEHFSNDQALALAATRRTQTGCGNANKVGNLIKTHKIFISLLF